MNRQQQQVCVTHHCCLAHIMDRSLAGAGPQMDPAAPSKTKLLLLLLLQPSAVPACMQCVMPVCYACAQPLPSGRTGPHTQAGAHTLRHTQHPYTGKTPVTATQAAADTAIGCLPERIKPARCGEVAHFCGRSPNIPLQLVYTEDGGSLPWPSGQCCCSCCYSWAVSGCSPQRPSHQALPEPRADWPRCNMLCWPASS